MKTKMLLTSLSLASVILLTGCKSDEPTSNTDNPIGTPVQGSSQ